MYDEILKKYGLKWEDLNVVERETLTSWVSALQKQELTLEKVREYLIDMRESVSQELENEPEFIRLFIFKFENRKQIMLKARLRNYRLIIALLTSPQKAQKALDEALTNIKIK